MAIYKREYTKKIKTISIIYINEFGYRKRKYKIKRENNFI